MPLIQSLSIQGLLRLLHSGLGYRDYYTRMQKLDLIEKMMVSGNHFARSDNLVIAIPAGVVIKLSRGHDTFSKRSSVFQEQNPLKQCQEMELN